MTKVELSDYNKTISDAETKEGISIIRNILLEDDRQKQQNLAEELEAFKNELKDKSLRQKVNPIVYEHLRDLKETFPEEFGGVITESIKKQVSGSQDEMVEALYPIMGQMIKKYVQSEIKKWLETIDNRLKGSKRFSGLRTWFGKLVAFLPFGHKRIDTLDSVVTHQYKQVEEIFIVEKDSGFILANYSIKENASKEVFIGLLTAMKAYGEDALNSKKEKLNTIQYDAHNIIMHDLYKFYIAIFVSGPINETFKSHLFDKLNIFVSDNLTTINQEPTQAIVQQLSEKLKQLISAEQENHST